MATPAETPPPAKWPSVPFVVLYLIGTALAIGSLLLFPPSSAKTIPYSEFRQMVRSGQVAEIVVEEHRIRGTAKSDGHAFETTRIDNPRLLEDLDQHGVKFTAEIESGWFEEFPAPEAAYGLPFGCLMLVGAISLSSLHRCATEGSPMTTEFSTGRTQGHQDGREGRGTSRTSSGWSCAISASCSTRWIPLLSSRRTGR